MHNKKSKAEFVALAAFLCVVALALTNGFSARIFAQEDDYFVKIEPIGEVLHEILKNYVYEPDLDRAVEGALKGIMRNLDERDHNSSFISAEYFKRMREETEGEFEGIGVRIDMNDEGRVYVWQPISGSPAEKAGMREGDIIYKIDGVNALELEMDSTEVARRIKGPRGQIVRITVLRPDPETGSHEELEFEIKRGRIPLKSIAEARILDGGIAYLRVTDFKKNTASDLKKRLAEFMDQGMKSVILDLRWNPGGLLTASSEVCDLFLGKNLLVTSTRGRRQPDGTNNDEMKLFTKRKAAIPETMPFMLLVGKGSASSSEIVTGALQYYRRAIVVGSTTFGKGSVQTIIPLRRPKNSALRLTTALYYTPANVTIDRVGIEPDVVVEMAIPQQNELRKQMLESFKHAPELQDSQNHGQVTGNPLAEDTVEDTVLARAVEILNEDPVFENLLLKYHRDPSETQVAAVENEDEQQPAAAQ